MLAMPPEYAARMPPPSQIKAVFSMKCCIRETPLLNGAEFIIAYFVRCVRKPSVERNEKDCFKGIYIILLME